MMNAHVEATRSRTSAALIACGAMVLLVLFAGTAFAQDPYVEDEPTVQPTLLEQPVEAEDEVLGEVQERRGVLPFTGGDLTLFAATGAALIGTGIAVRRVRRRDT